MRLFAREQLTASAEEQDIVKQQFVDWCDHWANFWDACLQPNRRAQAYAQLQAAGVIEPNFDQQTLLLIALERFEQEQEHLIAAINWANQAERWELHVKQIIVLVRLAPS
jgi:hypothetical protein